jgi:hypothetical protein
LKNGDSTGKRLNITSTEAHKPRGETRGGVLAEQRSCETCETHTTNERERQRGAYLPEGQRGSSETGKKNILRGEGNGKVLARGST